MNRAWRLFALSLVAAPALGFLVYRLAKGLGYMDPPANKEQEYRRTVSAALYAFLLFVPVFIYGYEKGWPRAWIFFAIINAIALLFFGAIGTRTGVLLWRLRHLKPSDSLPPAREDDSSAGSPASRAEPGAVPPGNPS